MQRIFSAVPWMMRLTGSPKLPGNTPAEQIQTLAERVEAINEPGRVLLGEYQLAEYSNRAYDMDKANRAVRDMWRKLVIHRYQKLARLLFGK